MPAGSGPDGGYSEYPGRPPATARALGALPARLASARNNARGRLHVLPDFYIIGAPRSGTTALAAYLASHPHVHIGSRKEVSFFGESHYKPYYTNLYRTNFPSRAYRAVRAGLLREGFAAFDATPSYMYYPHVPRRIGELTPGARLVACLRNPADRAWSAYRLRRRLGHDPSPTFEAALEAERGRGTAAYDRMLADPAYIPPFEYRLSYAGWGMYARHLRRWVDELGRDRFLFLQSEAMLADPARAYGRALRFLGLRPHRPASWGAWNSGGPGGAPPAARRALRDLYGPHNEELYGLIGERFGWD